MISHWIKMRKDLKGDPAVLLLSSSLGLGRREVVGLLHDFWSWADSNLVDGIARGLSSEHLDRLFEVPGFCDALVRAGWLEVAADSVRIPNFDRHLGDGAKRRAVGARRAAASRARRQLAHDLPPVAPAAVTPEPVPSQETSPLRAAEHLLVDEIARHLNLGYPKARRIVEDLGVTRDDWQSWLAHEAEHGTALTVQNIQRFRRPDQIPRPIIRAPPGASQGGLSRRSSYARPGKFDGIE